MHLGLIGYGNIADGLIALLDKTSVAKVSVLVRNPSKMPGHQPSSATEKGPTIRFVSDVTDLIAAGPDLVIECAGHSAVETHVPALLRAGVDVVIASVGALADADLNTEIELAAEHGHSRFILPSGAIGGLDLLRAVALAGDVDITYRGTKPPAAWKGSAAEDVIGLDELENAQVFFKGSGRKAALAFPKNANVVAALALAGGGFDRIKVELVADPDAVGNQHSYEVRSDICRYSVTIDAVGSAGNARTSVTTVMSLLHEIKSYDRQKRVADSP